MLHHHLDAPIGVSDADELRALARAKGYFAQRALRPGLWRLYGPDGRTALNPILNDTGFELHEAAAFLEELPGAPL